jgi:hypothetical protein
MTFDDKEFDMQQWLDGGDAECLINRIKAYKAVAQRTNTKLEVVVQVALIEQLLDVSSSICYTGE